MKKTLTLIVVSLSVVLCAPAAMAVSIDLTGVVRDFNSSHPDMEGAITGLVPGLVNPSLDPDKKPDFIGAPGAGAISSAASFDQWYRDVPGTNLSQNLTIALDNTITADPNVYTYSNSSFFPVDGQLYGNQGRPHNYHFTFELHSEFTYQGGEFFAFTGDDDLWVFINDQLVVDLGGVHPALPGSVDLDTLGLTVGDNYDLDLFFAERHTVASNFRIDTSIVLAQVPEPSSMLLLGGGLIGLATFGRRFRKR